MIWVAWRQHRAALLTGVLLLAAVTVPTLISGFAMHEEYRADGIAACVADPGARAGCAQLVEQFTDRYSEWGNRMVWVIFLPALVGAFVGAPLLAREFENGTWRFAFTQGVSRTRWLVTQLTLVGLGTAVLALACSLLFTWWRRPLDSVGSRMRSAAFTVSPGLVALTLFALALGVLAGVLLRRTVVAMGLTLVVCLTVNITLEEAARPHYLSPLVRTAAPDAGQAADPRPVTDWIVDEGLVDRAGHRLSDGEKRDVLKQVYDSDTVRDGSAALERYLADHGMRHYTEYHPASRYPAMLIIECSLYLGLAMALFAAAAYLVRRRTY
ncbi:MULTISPECIES: ABC transporter permease [Streptomyces]|uniref:ABC transporter permease subunit n=1 Tax=Streptomyces griseiscabiei TaxID=2993540 RepID=A0ABU4L1I5_9ACTN|nr:MULTISPECIES: ABC transporter permease subunit [Streptomyces]MBZ3900864.1 ABC transporter permease subunit [Streptomyces griseiscabiei]MDX2909008.1 ABC transporter permease subunit [Streptomyces griseiscabiei]